MGDEGRVVVVVGRGRGRDILDCDGGALSQPEAMRPHSGDDLADVDGVGEADHLQLAISHV